MQPESFAPDERVVSISWEAPEYEPKAHHSDWQWSLGIIAVTIGILAIMLGNILFGIVILLGSSVAALFAARPESIVRFTIGTEGVTIDEQLYAFRTLESFWIEEDTHDHPRLLIKPKRLLSQLLILPLVDVDVDEVHEFLFDRLAEEELEEPLAQQVVEFFGF